VNATTLPFLEASIGICLIGVIFTSLSKSQEKIRQITINSSFFSTLCCLIASYLSFSGFQGYLQLDSFSAPLLALNSILTFTILFCTPRTKFIGALTPFPAILVLLSQIWVILFTSNTNSYLLFALLLIEPMIPLLDLIRRGEKTRVFLFHFVPYWLSAIVLFTNLLPFEANSFLIILMVIIRTGIFPCHAWVSSLMNQGSFTISLLFMLPMPSIIFLLFNHNLLHENHAAEYLSWLAIISVIYFSGLTLVQKNLRDFYAYLILAFSAMLILGICTDETAELTAAYSLRNALCIGLTGIGIVIRSLEARHGRLSLFLNHGFYETTPLLGIAFLLCGLGCVGFPGTSAFISFEILADEVIPYSPYFGMVCVFSEALLSIALLMVYFKLFCGVKITKSEIFKVRLREAIALWTLIFLVFGARFLPHADITSSHHALELLLKKQQQH